MTVTHHGSLQLLADSDLRSCETSAGTTVVASRLASTPLVQVHLAIPVAPRGDDELAALDVLSATWPQLPGCRDLERLGGTVSVSRRRQWLILGLSALRAHLPDLLRVLRAVLDDVPEPDAVRRAVEVSDRQARLVAAQPANRTYESLWEQVYGATPPVLRSAPTVSALQTIDADVVRSTARSSIDPAGSRVVLVGDLDPDDAVQRTCAALATWTATGHRSTRSPLRTLTGPPALRRIADGTLPATQLRLAADSLPVGHPDAFVTAALGALILGGNFSSLLNEVVREREGIAYRTSAYLGDHENRVMLTIEADVTVGRTGDALRHIADLLDRVAQDGPDVQRLQSAIGYTVGSYELSLGSQQGRAACLLSYLTMGIGVEHIASLPDRLRSVGATDVRDLCRALFTPRSFWGVLQGAIDDTFDDGEFRYA